MNYEVVEAIDAENGFYKVVCETAGIIGNQQLGSLLPIEYIDGLESAELVEVLIPGEDEENVEAFRTRYFSSFSDTAFGGNKSDYKKTVNAVDGVGGCKIIRMWNGDISPSDLTPSEAVDDWYSSQTPTALGADVFKWITKAYQASKQSLLVKEQLHIKYYIRYTDNMLFFGNNKRKLHKALNEIVEYLKSIGLSLNDDWQVFKVDSRPVDFVGYRFFRDHTEVRKKTSFIG